MPELQGKAKDTFAEESLAAGSPPGAGDAYTTFSEEGEHPEAEGEAVNSEEVILGYASLHDKKENDNGTKTIEEGKGNSTSTDVLPPVGADAVQQDERQVRFAQ